MQRKDRGPLFDENYFCKGVYYFVEMDGVMKIV